MPNGLDTHLYGADNETGSLRNRSRAFIVQWSLVTERDRRKKKGLRIMKEVIEHDFQTNEGSKCLDSLMSRLRIMEDNMREKSIVYFHNLNFDFQFIRDEIYLDYLTHEDSHIIANNGKIIAVKVGNLELRDSAMKIPGKLKNIAPLVGLEKLESPRGNFDYGWWKTLTEDDFPYVDQDARIVYRAMKMLHEHGDTFMTQASDGFHEMRATYNKEHSPNGKVGRGATPWVKHYPRLSYGMDARIRRAYYGGINLSFHKGLNVASPDAPIVHEDVNSEYPTVMRYDPLPYGEPIVITDKEELKDWELYVLFAQFKLNLKEGMIPWFKPKNVLTRLEEDDDFDEVAWKHPIEHMDDFEPITLSSVDIMTLRQFYDVKIRFPKNWWAYGFRSEIGAHATYLDKWYLSKAEAKAKHDDVLKQRSKLKLNSCYGRFGMRVENEEYGFIYDPEIDSHVIHKDTLAIEDMTAPIDKPSYIPMAVFVCAWARHRLLQNVLDVGPETVIHADTDSVIHQSPPSSFSHGTEMGAWKIEQMPLAIYEGGFKRYIEVLKEGTPVDATWFSMAGAGIPHECKEYQLEYKGLHSVSVPIGMGVELYDVPERIYDDDLILGHEHYSIQSGWLRELYTAVGLNPDDVDTMKLQQKKVNGGCVLMDTTFNIKNLIKFR